MLKQRETKTWLVYYHVVLLHVRLLFTRTFSRFSVFPPFHSYYHIITMKFSSLLVLGAGTLSTIVSGEAVLRGNALPHVAAPLHVMDDIPTAPGTAPTELVEVGSLMHRNGWKCCRKTIGWGVQYTWDRRCGSWEHVSINWCDKKTRTERKSWSSQFRRHKRGECKYPGKHCVYGPRCQYTTNMCTWPNTVKCDWHSNYCKYPAEY